MQCSGSLGVSLMVHIGYPVWGGRDPRLHSKQPVLYGMITLAYPLNPSVPPSMNAFWVLGSKFPSASNSTKLCTIEFIQRLASILSSPAIITWNCL